MSKSERKNSHKMIAKAIINAQACSDSGKGITSSLTTREAEHEGYQLKVTFILRTLALIDGQNTYFRYYVEKRNDQNGYPSVLVYFAFRARDGWKQISFHTPLNKADGRLLSYVGKGTRMHWNHKTNGSREACELLSKIYEI